MGNFRAEDERRTLRLWITLARCYQTFARESAHHLAKHGLTTAQFGVMEALYHLGPTKLGDLADKLLVSGGNVTYVMDRLAALGYVTRDRCSEDRRVFWASLTEQGREFIAEVFPDHAAHLSAATDHLTGPEKESLRALLKKLGTGMAAPNASAAAERGPD